MARQYSDLEDFGSSAGAVASLDIDKKKIAGWHPADGLPDDWGRTESGCGQRCICRVVGGEKVYRPLLCKQWSCEVCGYYRYAWLVRNIVEAMKVHDVTRLLTLTLSTRGRTADESLWEIKAAWGKLLDRLRRKYGPFEYIWVVETTKAGYAHMHVLVSRFLEQAWLSRVWLELTGDSHMVDIRQLGGQVGARYVAKYIGKEARARRESGKGSDGLHFFGRSAGIRFDDFMKESAGWEVVMLSWRDNAEWLRLNCEPTLDTVWPSPEIRVPASGSTEWLSSWGKMPAAWPDEPPRAPPAGWVPGDFSAGKIGPAPRYAGKHVEVRGGQLWLVGPDGEEPYGPGLLPPEEGGPSLTRPAGASHD